jgi:hypothetical protein
MKVGNMVEDRLCLFDDKGMELRKHEIYLYCILNHRGHDDEVQI